MKRAFGTAAVVAALMSLAASFLGPQLISWYAAPPAGVSSPMVNCTGAIDWAMRRLLQTQLAFGIAGAVLGLIIGIRTRRPAAPAPSESGPRTP